MTKHNIRIIGIGIVKPMQVLTQAHHPEGAIGDNPAPSVSGEPRLMTLVHGSEGIPLLLTRQGYRGRFDIWKRRQPRDRQTLPEWNHRHVPLFSTCADDLTRRLLEAPRCGVTLYEQE